MTQLEKLTQWLKTFPLWDGQLFVDYTQAAPGNAGLFPGGWEEVSRKSDVLGNVTVKNRCRFSLYRVTTGYPDTFAQADWLLQFQSWVQSQSAAGKAPAFGDVPAMERLWAEKGTLKSAKQTGTGKYLVTLVAEFVKIYTKGEDYGEN